MSNVPSRCWISSIVELPNLYTPMDVIRACQHTFTVDDDTGEYDTSGLYHSNVYQGRDLCNLANVHKYKLEMVITREIGTPVCNVEVVGVSNAYFNNTNVMSKEVEEGLFYPIYMKFNDECYLFVESISEFLKEPGGILASDPVLTGSVISPLTLIDYALTLSQGPESKKSYRSAFTNIERRDTIPEIIYCCMVGERMDDMYQTYYEPCNLVPAPFNEFAKVRKVGHLKYFLSPYGCVPSDVAMRCMYMMSDHAELEHYMFELHQNNAIPQSCADINYAGDTELSITGKWLTGIFTAQSSDMEFTLDMRGDVSSKLADLYAKSTDLTDNFKKSWTLLRYTKDYLHYLEHGFSLFKYNLPSLLVKRSWMDDLTISDPATGKILLYVDLVFWMIASADGLINASVLDDLKLY